jgi:hypothetical protein
MPNLQLKEVANKATNKDFYNSFATSSKVTSIIGFVGQFISALTEFHFVFSAAGGTYQSDFSIKNLLAFVGGIVAIYIFEVVGVRIYLVKIIRQIVNKDFLGSERKVLFVFNLLFVLALCGTNLLTSWLGQKYSFASVTNVTTTDKTHDLSNELAIKSEAITKRFDTQKNDLKTTYNNDILVLTKRYDTDIKELKNSRYTHKKTKWKYDSYTSKIDKKLTSKSNDLSTLKSQYDSNVNELNSYRNTKQNDLKKSFTARINDVSKVENSKINLIGTIQKYTLPILIIFILLSWFAIIYQEIFLKGSGQKIEVVEVEKRPILFFELLSGLYEKVYQVFYYVVAKVIGSKKYKFGAIKQDVERYNLENVSFGINKQKQPIEIAAKYRTIGFNSNKKSTDNTNKIINNSYSVNTDDLSNYKSNDNDTHDNSITNIVVNENAPNRTCKNCLQGFTYKHHKQMYCSDVCRIENWEKRTGKKLKKKSKK